MADNIWQGKFAGRQAVPAWHRKGILMPDATRMVELLEAGNCDHEYILEPTYRTVEDANGEEQLILRQGRALIIKTQQGQIIDTELTVGSDFEFHQPREIAETLDNILEASKAWDNCNWKPETCFALGKGEKHVQVISLGTWDVEGDQMLDYLTLYDTVTGRGALQAYVTSIRAVCANTVAAGLAVAKVNLRIRHTRGHRLIFKEAVEGILESRGNVQAALSKLAKITCTEEQFDAYVKKAFERQEQITDKYTEAHDRRLGRLQLFAKNEWDNGLQVTSLENTAWHAYNAVQGVIEHMGEFGGPLGQLNDLMQQMGPTTNAIRKAYNLALEIN